MAMAARLLSPVNYLRVKHLKKTKYDWWLPIGMAVAATAIVEALPVQPNLLGAKGIIASFKGLLEILPGFYIASLAAIATFHKRDMDRPMPEQPPTLEITYRGHPFQLTLSRRRFLSLLFGYLAFMSLFIYLAGIVAEILAPSVGVWLKELSAATPTVGPYVQQGMRIFALVTYFFLLSNMFVTTLLGLYYLADRIHEPAPKPESAVKDGAE